MKNIDLDIGSEVRGDSPACSGRNSQMVLDHSQWIERTIQNLARHLDKPLQVNASLSHFFALFILALYGWQNEPTRVFSGDIVW